MSTARTPLLLQVGDRVGALDPAKLAGAFDPPPDHLATIWLAGPVAGQVADAVSTLVVLHARPNSGEQNPVMRAILGNDRDTGREAAFVATKIVCGIAASAGADFLAAHGREGTAQVISGIATALGLGAAIHNVRQL